VLEDELTAFIAAAEDRVSKMERSGDDIRSNGKEADKLAEDEDDEEVDDLWP
jgi:hypothetical protein